MAFLVCYSRTPPLDHCQQKAIYLDHRFYELIFSVCTPTAAPYQILKAIALLRNKSPTLVVPHDRLQTLADELATLAESGGSHAQIDNFQRACANAIANNLALTVSGDMYPEL